MQKFKLTVEQLREQFLKNTWSYRDFIKFKAGARVAEQLLKDQADNQNTTSAEWFTLDQIPPESDDPFFGTESIRVLGYTKFGSMKVVYCRQWAEEDEDPEPVKWYTTCSEGWDITDELTAWTFLPKAPK